MGGIGDLKIGTTSPGKLDIGVWQAVVGPTNRVIYRHALYARYRRRGVVTAEQA